MTDRVDAPPGAEAIIEQQRRQIAILEAEVAALRERAQAAESALRQHGDRIARPETF